MIQSILDTDAYKLSMQQTVLHQFPGTMVRYSFKCRNKVKFSKECFDTIANNVYYKLPALCLTTEELCYLKTIRFLKPDYLEYLEAFRFMPNRHVQITNDDEDLSISIKGPWLTTILYEIPILAIVNEAYFATGRPQNDYEHIAHTIEKNLSYKISLVQDLHDNNFKFADFGTRRRYSYQTQKFVLDRLQSQLPNNFVGTSNVHFSNLLGMHPIGTMAHEYIQCHQAMAYRLKDSQKAALENWTKEYRGDLGIALTDTINSAAFLRDFDLYFAKLYDGCRHDSGDPYQWCANLIDHYKKLNIDPMTKTAVFSDGLTIPKAIDIYKNFKDKIKMSFGIGTNLTNDVGLTPLQIVIKVVECNGSPVAKISDDEGKQMCEDASYVAYLKKVFKID